VNTILGLGFILLAGLFSARLINKIKFPAVTAYLLLGILIGPSILNLTSQELINSSGFISNIVLGLIAFGLGQSFTREFFRNIGRPVLWISILEAVLPWVLVTLSFFFILKQPFYVALLFGAIASATAPAATVMVVREYKAKGRFTDILLGVVAIDDAWCLIIFALSLAISKAVAFHASNTFVFKVIFHSLIEIIGALMLGGLIACFATIFSKFIRTQTELLIYTLGFILLTTGLAILLHLSVLLANMFLGTVLININKSNFEFFDVLKLIDSPLYLLFFVLAGTNLEIGLLKGIGITGIIYIFFRTTGKTVGSVWGGYIVKVEERIRRYLGLGLLPQAGVALGCALIAKSDFPNIGSMIFTTIVATTVIYELIGPICTKYALQKAGEINIEHHQRITLP
jgi:Kef-type K+ transport system membrane component KefB